MVFLNGLPKNNQDRLISLFYYSITTFTTTGFGDVYAKSNKNRFTALTPYIFIMYITQIIYMMNNTIPLVIFWLIV